ncbi:MAG: undecaprenyldiphospho-muramoylpentapeptide beta-N-acetylglucosaminyltransferase, partial [Desulfobacterales bacterium]
MRVIIAGGGTGGHLFPGIAIAQELMARDQKNMVLFVNSGRPFERSILSKTGFEQKSITAEGIKGRSLWRQISAVLKIPKGIYDSVQIMSNFRPEIVIGIGSYGSGVVVLGAWLKGLKVVLHEQNIIPGITNRILSHFADRIYVSFEKTKDRLNPKRVRVTGNPVRKEILKCSAGDAEKNFGDEKRRGRLTVLIVGGSQGAHSINMAVLEALEKIDEKEKFYFIHQSGVKDFSEVRHRYRDLGFMARVESFFSDMASLYQQADLVICRSGATTVAEITAVGKGVIFIPYPFAADDHQSINAKALKRMGAAEMIPEKDLTGEMLSDRIRHYASHRVALHQM